MSAAKMAKGGRVLVVDDEEFVRASLVEILACEGFRAEAAAGAAEALERLGEGGFDLVVTDLAMPGADGHELLARARAVGHELPFVVLTGAGTVADAVRAMREGAYDFVEKPVDPHAFALLLKRALEHRDLERQVRFLHRALADRDGSALVGESPWFRGLEAEVSRLAQSDAPLLVHGESGSGKNALAAAVHRKSVRGAGPLVRLACHASAGASFESELFGHRRRAFGGATEDRVGRLEEARGGTLVLDAVEGLGTGAQAALLALLEGGRYRVLGEAAEREADVRLVATTQADLGARVRKHEFRGDLLYRLEVLSLAVPPLRERREDIAALASAFLARLSRAGERALSLGQGSLELLAAYDWPGNVRELENVLERAALLSPEDELFPELFHGILEASGQRASGDGSAELNLRLRTDSLQRELIEEALQRTDGKKREAALLLGIDPRNLGYYLRKHRLGSRRPGGAS